MKKRIRIVLQIILLFVLIPNFLPALDGANVAIYTDNGVGTWEDGINAFEIFLDWKGISHERILALDINNTDLRPLYDAIYFPGGYACTINWRLTKMAYKISEIWWPPVADI